MSDDEEKQMLKLLPVVPINLSHCKCVCILYRNSDIMLVCYSEQSLIQYVCVYVSFVYEAVLH